MSTPSSPISSGSWGRARARAERPDREHGRRADGAERGEQGPGQEAAPGEALAALEVVLERLPVSGGRGERFAFLRVLCRGQQAVRDGDETGSERTEADQDERAF